MQSQVGVEERHPDRQRQNITLKKKQNKQQAMAIEEALCYHHEAVEYLQQAKKNPSITWKKHSLREQITSCVDGRNSLEKCWTDPTHTTI